VLRSIIESPEYRDALKQRLLAGKATASEIGLARELGVTTAVSIKTKADAEREAMRIMPVDRRRLMTDTIREYRDLVNQVLAGTVPTVVPVDPEPTDDALLPGR
jgi:hypothetical protein